MKKTTRAELERKLIREADAQGLEGARRNAYVYGTLDKQFPRASATRRKASSIAPKRRSRKKNPVGAANRQTKIEHAMRLFERFRLEEPQFVEEVKFVAPDVCMVIGFADFVGYTTKRDGKVEEYIHEFAKKSRPLLVSSWDGTQLMLIGGRYNFTKDGIVDY